MKNIVVEQEQKIAYYSEDMKNRYLLKVILNDNANVNEEALVIMLNPRKQSNLVQDTIIKDISQLFSKKENSMRAVNIMNLFPFEEDEIEALHAYLNGRDMRKFMAIKHNLAMLRLAVKKADKIILAWGDVPENFVQAHYQTAIKDVYHLLKIFRKEKNCFVFSLKDKLDLVHQNGHPRHPREGSIDSLKKIVDLWIENAHLTLVIEESNIN